MHRAATNTALPQSPPRNSASHARGPLPPRSRRFMKLRLDRVLRIDLGAVPEAEALAVGGKVPEFKVSPKWTAPYPKYSPGWWEVFEPK
jgi:hypothetical protein